MRPELKRERLVRFLAGPKGNLLMVILNIGHIGTLLYVYWHLYLHILYQRPMPFDFFCLKYIAVSVSILTNIAYFSAHKKIIRHVTQITEQDAIFKLLDPGVTPRALRLNIIYKGWLLMFIGPLVTLYLGVSILEDSSEVIPRHELKHFLKTFVVTCGIFVLMQIINWMFVIYNRLIVLNRQVQRFYKTAEFRRGSPSADVFKISNFEQHSSVTVEKVIQISAIYNLIRSISLRLKSDFAFQYFMFFSNDFVVITLELLLSYKSFESGQSLLSTVFHFYDGALRVNRIFWIVTCSSAIKSQTEKLVYNVQALMNSPSINAAIREQLKLLLMELKDKKITFTISGFLKLELPTLVSFLKGVFTNLLILLQFSGQNDSEDSL